MFVNIIKFKFKFSTIKNLLNENKNIAKKKFNEFVRYKKVNI